VSRSTENNCYCWLIFLVLRFKTDLIGEYILKLLFLEFFILDYILKVSVLDLYISLEVLSKLKICVKIH
jgi:hypothetical protein